jgi:hypothetical protein
MRAILSALVLTGISLLASTSEPTLAADPKSTIRWFQVTSPRGEGNRWKPCPSIFDDQGFRCNEVPASYVREKTNGLWDTPDTFFNIIYGIDGYASCGTSICVHNGRLRLPLARIDDGILVGIADASPIKFAVSNSGPMGVAGSLHIFLHDNVSTKEDWDDARKATLSALMK